VHARVAVREWAATVHELRFAILTVTPCRRSRTS
jgi:lactate permease